MLLSKADCDALREQLIFFSPKIQVRQDSRRMIVASVDGKPIVSSMWLNSVERTGYHMRRGLMLRHELSLQNKL